MLSLVRFALLLLLPVVASAESFYWGGQRTVTEIKEATEFRGNLGAGSDAFTNYKNYINGAGCPSTTWRPCSMSDIRQAYANHVTGWNTIQGGSFGCAWVNGYDPSVVTDAAMPATTNCVHWTSQLNTDRGLVFCPPETTVGTEFGFSFLACHRLRTTLCCR